MAQAQFTILDKHFAELKKTLAKLEKLANKMGRDFSYDLAARKPVPFQIEQPDPFSLTGEPKRETVYFDAITLTIDFDGDNLLNHANGRFVASMEVTDGGVAIFTSPDYDGDIPASYYKNHSNHCDHCGHNRPRRHFFLIEQDGKLLQVGSSCVKEFIGINPAQMLSVFKYLETFTTMGGDEPREMLLANAGWGHHVKTVAHAAAVVVSVDQAYYKGETWNTVSDLLYPPICTHEAERHEYKLLREKYAGHNITFDFDDFARFVENMDENNYTNNLKVIVNSTSVSKRQSFAILVSGVYVYLKEQLTPPTPKAEHTILDEWVNADLKQRLTFHDVKVIYRKCIESIYGESILYKMLDNAGRPLTWFSTYEVGELEDAYESGTTIASFTATVKKFDEYNGKKQTIVNRGKVAA